MKALIAYGTTEGQTRKIAEHVAERVGALGGAAQLHNSERHAAELRVGDHDVAIIVASIHQQAHQATVARFVVAHLDALQALPTLFLSVSLSAAFDDKRAEAQNYVDTFLTETGWTPTATHLVAGALRPSQYDYFEQEIVERVVLKGHESEAGEGDRELTDWDDLTEAVTAFLKSAGAGQAG